MWLISSKSTNSFFTKKLSSKIYKKELKSDKDQNQENYVLRGH